MSLEGTISSREELDVNSPFEWSIFKISYRSIYDNLTFIHKIFFLVGVVFHVVKVIATITVLSIYYTTGSTNGLVIAFILWTCIGILNLLFPLYFTIRQDHFEIRENIILERMKQACHSAFNYPYFFLFAYQCAILFFQPQPQKILYFLLLINVILGFCYTFFPALLAVAAILCLPCIYIFVRDGRLREEARQRALGASQSLINSIPIYKFRKQGEAQADLESPPIPQFPAKKRFRLFSRPKQQSSGTIQAKPKPKEWLEIEDGDAHCSICLNEYEPGEELRQLGCKHHYHVKCIDGWLTLNAVCPNCRGMDLVGSSSAAQNQATALTAVVASEISPVPLELPLEQQDQAHDIRQNSESI